MDFVLDDFTTLAEGTAVHVVEVVRLDDVRRVRGRIDRPVEATMICTPGVVPPARSWPAPRKRIYYYSELINSN